MKKIKIASAVMAVAITMGALSGCGGSKKAEEVTTEVETAVEKPTAKTPSEKIKGVAEFNTDVSIRKIGTIAHSSVTYTDSGVFYREGDKYGIATFDGKHDTGAIYDYCTQRDNYFLVAKNIDKEATGIESMNKMGVVDVMGNELVPAQYASISVLSDRYIKVCEVTEETENKEEALVYSTERMFSVWAEEGDTFYKGVWYIYDTETKDKIPQATGVKATHAFGHGECLSYKTDDGEEVFLNAKGEVIEDVYYIMDNGKYAKTENGRNIVYDEYSEELFSYPEDEWDASSYLRGYYMATKRGDEGNLYAYLDEEGHVVSATFSEYPTVYGDFVLTEKGVYNFKGDLLLEGKYTNDGYTDRGAIVVKNDSEYILLTNKGEIVWRFPNEDSLTVYGKNLCAMKKINDANHVYSYKDKDFTIKASTLAPFLVEEYDTDSIVNTVTGEVMISGYNYYDANSFAEGTIYIFARKHGENATDVYVVE